MFADRGWFARLLIVLPFVIGISAHAAEAPVLLFPPDLTLSDDAKVKVFALQKGKGAPVVLTVNGKKAGALAGKNFQMGEVALQPGLNRIKAGGKEVRVYFRKDAGDALEVDSGRPKGKMLFRAYRIHPAMDDGCEGCHVFQGGKVEAKSQKEACYACHDDFGKEEGGRKKYLHDPVANGECTSCHDPHFSFRPKLFKLEKGCHECHDPFPADGYVHKPLKTGACTACHNPHAGAAPKLLVRPAIDLCTECHKDYHANHRKVRPGSSMVRLPADFPTDGERLECPGCHSPHQSANPRLLVKGQPELCKMCHPE